MSDTAYRTSPQQRRAWTLQRDGGGPRGRPLGSHLILATPPGDAVSGAEIPGAEIPSAEFPGAEIPGIEGALRRAVVAATVRHEVLRTRLEQPAGLSAPVQRIASVAGPPPAVIDLSALGERARRESAHRAAAGAPLGSDLGGSLFGALLLRLPGGESRLLLSLASAAGDAVSISALAAEIAADATGAGAPQPDLQYPDAAEWQLTLLEGDSAAEGRDFWRRRGAGAADGSGAADVAAGALPLAAASAGRFRPRELHRPVSTTTQSAVAKVAATVGVDPSAVWLAAWAWLLTRLADRPRVTIGALADGRRLDELRFAQGPFARYLPLVLEPDPRRPLTDAAHRVAEELEEATGWQEALASDEVPTPELLFEVVPPAVPCEPFRVVARRSLTEPFLLRLALDPAANGEEGESSALILGRDESRIDDALAEEWSTALVALIEAAAANPEAPLGSLPFAVDRSPAAAPAIALSTVLPAARSAAVPDVVEVIARCAAERPDATAVLDGFGAASYGEIAAAAGRIADRLAAQGVGTDDVVAVHLPRDRRFVAAVLGVMAAGAAYLPLDPDYPRPRLLAAMEDAAARALVTGGAVGEEELAEWFAARGGTVLRCDPRGDSEEATEDGTPPTLIPRSVPPAAAAYVLFTSGSTGRPKGVVVPRSALAASAAARGVYYRRPVGVYLLLSSFSFDSSVAGLFWTLANGGALALPPDGFQRDLPGLLATAERWGVTHLLALPSLWRLLLDEAASPGRLAGLRCVIVAGEACPASLLEFHYRVTPHAELHNEYGPTEGTVWASVAELRTEAPGAPVPIGKAAPHAHLHLRDRPSGGSLPAGVPGELLIGGAGVARGYVGRPAETAVRFVPDPWAGAPGARLYRSGDRAWRRGDGAMVFLGRSDRQLKVRGHRVEPAEIELLLGEHPEVRAAAVVAAGVAEELRLTAWVEAAGAPSELSEELRRWLGARLPEPLVPSVIAIAAALPRLPNGKLDRGTLADREPEPARPPYVEPESEAERALADVWSEILGIERVGAADDFFRLGGDSILTVRVRAAASARGLQFSVQEVFNHPTVRALAAVARQESPAPPAAEGSGAPKRFEGISNADRGRLPVDAEDAFPLLALQEGMLFESARDAQAGHYVDAVCFDLAMPFDEAALRRALGWLAGAHPVLRTSLHLHGFEQPLQVVHRWAEIPLEIGAGPNPPSAEELLAGERARGFDTERAPLVRLTVHRLDERRVRLVVCEHHAILDGWSAASFLTELLRLYRDLVSDVAVTPPEPPPVGMRRAVELEREALDDPAAEAFWRERLSAAPAAALPPAAGAPTGSPGGRRELPITLSEPLARSVRQLAQTLAVPVRTVLLTAHLRCLAEFAGTADVVTGLVTHGRPEEEGGERALGLFLNTAPFPLRLRPESWRELVARVHASEAEMIPHRRYPLAELVRQRGGPLFDNAFNFVHFHVQRQVGEMAGFEVLAASAEETTEMPLVATFRSEVSGSGLAGELIVDQGRLGAFQCKALAALYPRVLAAMTEDPGRRHDRFASGSAPSFEAGDGEVPWRARLDDLAGERPDEAAVRSGGQEISFARFRELALGTAARLEGHGVGPEEVLPVLVDRTPQALAALVGVLVGPGAVFALDPGEPFRRLAGFLAGSGARRALVGPRHRELAERLGLEPLMVDELTAEGGGVPRSELADDDLLGYLVATSGSTGAPKRVAVARGHAVAHGAAMAARLGLRPDDRLLQFAGWSFDLAIEDVTAALAAGASWVLRGDEMWQPAEIDERLAEDGVTVASLPTAVAHAWLEERGSGPAPAGLRTVLVGGEALHPEVVAGWRRGPLADVELINHYGPAEVTVAATAWRLPVTGRSAPGPVPGPVPIGTPLPGRAAIVAGPFEGPTAAGCAGELLLAGRLARGYSGAPAQTAERFVPDILTGRAGARLYRTGDRVLLDEAGDLVFLGRRDRQVKVRGVRVEPAEVEAALEEHPSVRRSAVVAAAGGAGSGAGPFLAAYVEAPPPMPAAEELVAFLRRRLPPALIPSSWAVIDALPRTVGGKIDRAALPKAAPAVAPDRTPPASDSERRVAEVFSQLLGIAEVAAEDDFFLLGGHSLLAGRAAALLRDRLEVDLTLGELLAARTVRAIARIADRRRDEPLPVGDSEDEWEEVEI